MVRDRDRGGGENAVGDGFPHNCECGRELFVLIVKGGNKRWGLAGNRFARLEWDLCAL